MLKIKNIIQFCLLSALFLCSTPSAFANDIDNYQGSTNVLNGYQGAYSSDYSYNLDSDSDTLNLNNSNENEVITSPEQLKQALEQTGTIPKNSRVVGKTNKDGQELIAIENGNSDSTMIVTIQDDGTLSSDVAVINPNKVSTNGFNDDSVSAQQAYDYIMNNNELETQEDVDSLNQKLQDSEFINQVSNQIGASNETTTGSMAGLATVFGLISTGKVTKQEKSFTADSFSKYNLSHNMSSVPGVFDSCISEEEYDGMTSTTKDFVNSLTNRFYTETGITLNLTSGYRAGDSGWHGQGMAFDVTSDAFDGENGKYYRDMYVSMANAMGGTALDEYPGEAGEVYANGSNIHVSVHNQYYVDTDDN